MDIKFWWPLTFVLTILAAALLIFPSDLRLADLFNDAGRFDEAIAHYENALAEDPNRDDIRVELANLYLLKGENDKALHAYQAAFDEIKTDPHLLQRLYQLHSERQNKTEVITVLEQLAKISSDSLEISARLAEAYAWNGDFDKAAELYDALIRQHPDRPDFLEKVARLHAGRADYATAATYARKWCRRVPEHAPAWEALGDFLLAAGDRLAGAAAYESALNIAPDHEPLRFKLAELYEWMSDHEKSLHHYEYLSKHNLSNDKYFDAMLAASEIIAPERALPYCRLRLQRNPEDLATREKLIDRLLLLGAPDKAITESRILAQQKDDTASYVRLAYLYKSNYEFDEAAQVFQSLFDAGNIDNEIVHELIEHYRSGKAYSRLASVYHTLQSKVAFQREHREGYADLLLRTGDFSAAEYHLKRLIKGHPTDPSYRRQLSYLFALQGKPVAGLKLLREGMLEYNIKDPGYLYEAARLFAKHGWRRERTLAYEKLHDVNPESQFYTEELARSYLATNDYDAAIRTYRDLVRRTNGSVRAYFNLAEVFSRQEDFDAMYRVLDTLMQSQKTSDIQRQIGDFYLQRGIYDSAVSHLERYLATVPNDSTALRKLGLAHAWNSNSRAAREVLEKYNRLYPDDYYAHFQLGLILKAENDETGAEESLATALELLESTEKTRESLTVEGRILALNGDVAGTNTVFSRLIRDARNDTYVMNEYAEALIDLQKYDRARYWTSEVQDLEPANGRALRLEARAAYEQADYDTALDRLQRLAEHAPRDSSLWLSISDVHAVKGDWYRNTAVLQEMLQRFPTHLPARERLYHQRRDRSESLASGANYEEQSGDFVKEIFDFVFSEAKSSMLHVQLFLTRQAYSRQSLDEENSFWRAGINLLSRLSQKVSTKLGIAARRDDESRETEGRARIRWHVTQGNEISFGTELNTLWDDPLAATLLRGYRHRLSVEASANALTPLYLWSHILAERHLTESGKYGDALRVYQQIGTNWGGDPAVSIYYQLYHLRYMHASGVDRSLLSIPETETIHYVGAGINDLIGGRFYYEVGGSAGYNQTRKSMVFFASIDLEYMLWRSIKLGSRFAYGNQSNLLGNATTKQATLRLYYYY